MMTVRHKNKTLAAFLGVLIGGMGSHRFYLHGMKDFLGWAHLFSIPATLFGIFLWPGQPVIFVSAPLVISAIIAWIEALVIGLTADDKWDANHNPNSGRHSDSGWLLVILLVLSFGIGAIALIAAIARTIDLLFTAGAYG